MAFTLLDVTGTISTIAHLGFSVPDAIAPRGFIGALHGMLHLGHHAHLDGALQILPDALAIDGGRLRCRHIVADLDATMGAQMVAMLAPAADALAGDNGAVRLDVAHDLQASAFAARGVRGVGDPVLTVPIEATARDVAAGECLDRGTLCRRGSTLFALLADGLGDRVPDVSSAGHTTSMLLLSRSGLGSPPGLTCIARLIASTRCARRFILP